MMTKHFYQMTADELRKYRGPKHTARCTICHRHSGNNVPHDFEAPTIPLLDELLRDARRTLGPIVSKKYFVSKGNG